MKKTLLLFLSFFITMTIAAQCYCGRHTECYEGQTLVLKGLDWVLYNQPQFCHNLFMDFDESKKKLKKPIKLERTKPFLGSQVMISRVIPNVEYDERLGSVFVLENNTWGTLYYFYCPGYAFDNERDFQFKGDIYCKAYYDGKIREKVDKFEGVTSYYTPKIKTGYFEEGITGFKSAKTVEIVYHDSLGLKNKKDTVTLYSLKIDIVRDSFKGSQIGVVVLLSDGTQLRNESCVVDVNFNQFKRYV